MNDIVDYRTREQEESNSKLICDHTIDASVPLPHTNRVASTKTRTLNNKKKIINFW